MKKKSNAQMGLEPKSFPKHKQWAVDQDYKKDLDPEAAEWLGRFNQEYYRNRFESIEKDLHNTPELKKSCYSNENARNRDLYAIKSTGNMVDDFGYSDDNDHFISELDLVSDGINHEDSLIAMIDAKGNK
jgi:hypothetical protein